MRRIRFSAFLLLLVTMLTATAESINESQAREIASRFMASHAMPTTSLKMAHKAPRLNSTIGQNGQAAYYVFNASQGFVIVAGDDRAPAVLGYSDKGTFDSQDVPEAMQEMLDSYAEQIADLEKGLQAASHLSNVAAIAPLVSASWSQNSPFNYRLPLINGKHAYVGCVATALAQVLYYWKWPIRPTRSIPSYTSENLSIYMPELPIVSFDWNNMKDTYLTSDSTSIQAWAAATLSLYSAQAVTMDFKKNSSSAYSSDIPYALTNYFGYSSDVKYNQRLLYTTDEWENMIYNEIADRRPVIYSGSKSSGGHAFVCDGYDGNGRFHINWGWNSQSNGYFLLSVLSPDAQGTGGASGSDGYILRQSAITGIKPGNQQPYDLEVSTKYIEVLSYTSTRNSTNTNFTVSQTTHFMNYMPITISFDFGWGLYRQDNTLVSILSTSSRSDLRPMYYIYPTQTLAFGANLTSGTYRILPIYSERAAANWRPCIGSNLHYIEVTINGNSCTMNAHGLGSMPNYQVNDISMSGHMHPNRPVEITMNLTNMGNTRNDVIYMFADGTLKATGFVDVEKGKTTDVGFQYTRETAGTSNLTFSFDEDGKEPFASRSITIDAMPAATLSSSVKTLNVTDEANRIITSDKMSVQVTISNTGTSTYNEDITIRLYKHIYDNYGTMVETQSVPISLSRRQSTTVQFDLDNVMDNWRYFAKIYYYSEGELISLGGTGFYTIVFPTPPGPILGDVNNDGEVNIADINVVIDILLGRLAPHDVLKRADVDGNGEINIGDINAIIEVLLGH